MEVTLDMLRAAGERHLPGLLGVEITRAAAGLVVGELEVHAGLFAPNGFLHAAAVVGLADTACGYGAMLNLPAGATGFTTVELKSNFVGTARDGRLRVEARLAHGGRTTQLWQAPVARLADGKPMAHFSCTQLVLY